VDPGFWSDPILVGQNAAGRIARAQYDFYVKQKIRVPYLPGPVGSLVASLTGRRRRLAADLTLRRVRSGKGEIRPGQNGRPQARIGDIRLHVPPNAPPLPPPGRYRMFWLRRDLAHPREPKDLLLSVDTADEEPRRGGLTVADADRLRPLVLKAFRATEADLEANRAGRMSPSQHRARVRALRWEAVGHLVLAAGVGAVTLMYQLSGVAPAPVLRALGLGLAFILGGIIDGTFHTATPLGMPEPVVRLTGPVTADSEEGSTVRVGPDVFPVGREVAEAFFARGTYAVHVWRDRVLTAEPVPTVGPDAVDPASRDRPPRLDNPDYVSANAAGHVTPHQRRLLLGLPPTPRWGLLATLLAYGVGAVIAPGPVWVLVPSLGTAAGLALLTVWAWRRSVRDWHKRLLAEHTDICTGIGEVGRWGEYLVNGVRLIPPRGAIRLPSGCRYRFYWLAGPPPRLLSAQRIGG
jgi:hypothetical protein